MNYPKTIEKKLGIDEIRRLLQGYCISTLGHELVNEVHFSTDSVEVNEWLCQVREMRRIKEEADDFPMDYIFDVRQGVARLRLEGTHLETQELFDLRRSMETVVGIVNFLNNSTASDDDEETTGSSKYPTLLRLARDVQTFPMLTHTIDRILDSYGNIKDSASPELGRIRSELKRTEGSISRTLYNILRSAQQDGVVEKDISPTLRDGRLVIPVAPAMKRKIRGIVHDESASGKTVFIEPTEVVEANNRVRELEADERREIIKILTDISKELRPHVKELLEEFRFLAQIDLIRAKSQMADDFDAYEPVVEDHPTVDWIRSVHPLLRQSLSKQNKDVVPLEIALTHEKRLLVISGPNAGGKSVCLKTMGLLQYMVQCGLSIPVSERSSVGMFESIMIDIGDEQSIEDDLSTYSSHLLNMKMMIKGAGPRTLLLIDEFGGGTEPQIGGAIAEAVLGQFWESKAWGIITTHYQNLKHFAEDHKGVVNGAMLYDRHEMRPLFQLEIGRPGSSFAIEIARKTGLPENVIKEASEIVGRDYIQSDKYLQDIVRDKRYWESKRQNIHQQEKQIQQSIDRYETRVEDLDRERRAILTRAKREAEELLAEANKRIENTIREIREQQAEKEATKKMREELAVFREEVQQIDATANDEAIAKKMAQIQQRRERHQKRQAEKAKRQEDSARAIREAVAKADLQRASAKTIEVGTPVRIKGTTTVGTVETIQGKLASVIFDGGVRSRIKIDSLEYADQPKSAQPQTKQQQLMAKLASVPTSTVTRNTIDEHKRQFSHDIDVRGMRGDEALDRIMHFIDDAILMGVSQVKILHGKGNGILRQLIRQYLKSVPNIVSFRDEDVRFGGAGITVAEL